MAIYVSTSCLRGGRDALTVIRKYVDSGIRHIEIGSAHASTSGLNELLTIPGLHLAAHGPFTGSAAPRGASIFSDDPVLQEQSVHQVLDALRLCPALGAAFYTFHPLNPGDQDIDWQAGISALKKIAHVAEELGVVLGIENVHYGKLSGAGSPDPAAELRDLVCQVGSPMLKVLIDLGHLKLAAVQGGLDPERFIRMLAPCAVAVHVHDNDGQTDEHLPVTADSDVAAWLKMPELSKLPTILEVTRQTMPEILNQLTTLEWLIREEQAL